MTLMTYPRLEVRTCVKCGHPFQHRSLDDGASARTALCYRCATHHPGRHHGPGVIALGQARGTYIQSPNGFLGIILGDWKAGDPIRVRWENHEVREYQT